MCQYFKKIIDSQCSFNNLLYFPAFPVYYSVINTFSLQLYQRNSQISLFYFVKVC